MNYHSTAFFFFFGPAPWGPGEGSKGQIIISYNFNYKVNFKDFYTKLCVFLTNERYKTYQMSYLFCSLGHAPGVGLGALGCPGCQQFFFQTWSCGISNPRG